MKVAALATVIFLASFAAAQEADPVALFNLGQDAQEKGDFKKAIELYEKAIELFPDFPEAEHQKAAALLSLGDLKQAENGFRRAIQLRPDWTLPMTSLAFILIKKGDFTEAEKLVKQALTLDTENQKAYVLLTEIKLKTRSSDQELQEIYLKIKPLTEKANPIASLWAARAAIERRLGNLIAAKNSLNQALEIDPDNLLALSEKIEVALYEDDTATAISSAEKLLKLSDSIEGRIMLARAFLAENRKDEAQKVIQNLDNSNPEVQKAIKLIEPQLLGTEALEKQLELEPENVVILSRLCVLTRKENPLKSVEYCKRYFEKEPERAASAYGAALIQAKQYEPAVKILREFIRKSPENYSARANLATALFQLKRYKEAKEEYLWLAEKNPKSPVIYYFLAVTSDHLGEYAQAFLNYREFLRLADPEKHKLEIEKVQLRLPILQKKLEKK
ncbi:MAG: tetratricopeptide repeat protein [Pyrinomonadaceae bacterium]|nr:tetratricopeptide repeat protein [Pyrinomonadaceae bacterium]